MVIRRGEIWWASGPEPVGSGPGARRPYLVISADDFNDSRILTVVGALITSNLRLGDAPGNVALSTKVSGLPQPSVVNVSQVLSLDKRDLTDRVGRLPAKVLAAVDDGLRLALGL